MKDISKKRVSRVLAESYENDYFAKFKNLCSELHLDTDSFDTDLAIFEDGSGFEYEDQGGHLEVNLYEDGHWYWEDSDFSETTSEGEFETEHNAGNGGWNALIDSLFNSDLSIFVATPYTAADFKEEDDLHESHRVMMKKRVRESSKNTFEDLYKDQSSPYYYMSDDTAELLTSIESDTGLGPDSVVEILTNMVEGKYSFGHYKRRDYRDNYRPYMGEDAAYNLFCIQVITKEQFIEITKHYKQEGIKVGH